MGNRGRVLIYKSELDGKEEGIASQQNLYYNPRHEASFGGLEKLYRTAKATKNNQKISRNDVRNWLRSQETYTLHKPVRRNYPRNKVFVDGIDDQFEADLADLQSLSAQNDNYRFLLVCILIVLVNTPGLDL